MAYQFHEVKEAPIVLKVPPRTLPLEFCYLAHDYYEFLSTHGLKDFAKVTAISCVRNNLAKGLDDYFITTVTHTDTEGQCLNPKGLGLWVKETASPR